MIEGFAETNMQFCLEARFFSYTREKSCASREQQRNVFEAIEFMRRYLLGQWDCSIVPFKFCNVILSHNVKPEIIQFSGALASP